MKAAVLVFPGSNCDRDLAVAFRAAGFETEMVWHKDDSLPEGVDIVGVPGGFSFGDYLRCGAIAANAPIIAALHAHVARGGYAIGICNGFQVLTETKILPGALLRNSGQKFIGRSELIRAEGDSVYAAAYGDGVEVAMPIAHHDGNYFADTETLDRLEGEGRVAFRYANNPNGSARDIAGILSENRRVIGMMPHPERAVMPGDEMPAGTRLFAHLAGSLVAA